MKYLEKDIHEMLQDSIFEKDVDGVYLITGANGFIGSYCVRAIMERNILFGYRCKVIASVYNLEKGCEIFKEYEDNPYFRLWEYDVIKNVGIDEEKIDYIIHAASVTSKEKFHENPADVINTILLGNYNICEMAKKFKSKLLFISTALIYGNVERDYILEENVNGFDTMKYENCYAEGKRAAETMIATYIKQYGLNAKVVRLFHVYGPGNSLYSRTFFSDFLCDILKKDSVTMQGNGGQIRNLCYVTDVIRGIFYVLYLGAEGKAYNIGSLANNLSIKEYLDKLLEVSDRKKMQVVKLNREQKGNVMFKQCPSVDKLCKLGWKENVSITEGLRKTYFYYKDIEE